MSDNEDTDDEMQYTTFCMIRTRMSLDPPSYGSNEPPESEDSQDIIQVRAHFEYYSECYLDHIKKLQCMSNML